jgi:hypothetical protein
MMYIDKTVQFVRYFNRRPSRWSKSGRHSFVLKHRASTVRMLRRNFCQIIEIKMKKCIKEVHRI